MKKSLALILIILLLSGTLSGCYDRRELNNLAYVVGIGLDKGSNNFIRITLQIAVPLEIAEGGDPEDTFFVKTIEAPSLSEGFSWFNIFLSKEINLSHSKVIVFSQELAKDGLLDLVEEIIREREIRPSAHIVISQSSSEEYFNSLEPFLETNPAIYHELIHKNYIYTGFSADISLNDFYMGMKSNAMDAVAPMIIMEGEIVKGTPLEDIIIPEEPEENGNEGAIEGPPEGGENGDDKGSSEALVGLAVFSGGRMVGYLNAEETSYYLLTKGDFRHSYITIPKHPSGLGAEGSMVLKIYQDGKPRQKVTLDQGHLIITQEIFLEADLFHTERDAINFEGDKLDELEGRAKEFLEKGILNYLNYTRELGTDINGYGRFVKGNFLTWAQWEDFDWLNKYKDAQFDLDVRVKIRRPGI